MSHKTNKKLKKKELNDRKRIAVPFNTGTRNMGFNSNQDRKEAAIMDSIRNSDQDN
ncbi:MAG: hypothetical protein J5857_08685 [Treponema sp.]|nr:hypothetical protein [Treponema sp.]